MPKISIFLKPDFSEKLKNLKKPIHTVEEFLVADLISLMKETGTNIEELERIKIDICCKCLSVNQSNDLLSAFQNAIPTTAQLSIPNIPCSTGFDPLDKTLKGGFPTASISQIIGGSGTGKTQLTISTAVASARKGLKVLILDTCNAITPKTIHLHLDQTLKREQQQGLVQDDAERKRIIVDILSRIFITHQFSIYSVMDTLCRVRLMKEHDLLLLDSLHHLLTPFLTTSSVPNPRTSLTSASSLKDSGMIHVDFNPVTSQLLLLLKSFSSIGITVVVTNVVQTNLFKRTSTGGTKLPPAEEITGGPFLDVFDVIVQINRLKPVEGMRASFVADILLRPPYMKNLPNQCEIFLP